MRFIRVPQKGKQMYIPRIFRIENTQALGWTVFWGALLAVARHRAKEAFRGVFEGIAENFIFVERPIFCSIGR